MCNAFQTGAKIYLSKKNILGLWPVKDQYLGLNGAKRRNAFQTGAKIYLSKKNILGIWAL